MYEGGGLIVLAPGGSTIVNGVREGERRRERKTFLLPSRKKRRKNIMEGIARDTGKRANRSCS